jgi:hypothetical protein
MAAGASAPYTITANPQEPGLLAPSSFLVGGKQYAVAPFTDGVTYVPPTGAIPDLASRPPARSSDFRRAILAGRDSGAP